MPALTPNAVGRMLDNDLELKPTVQCIGVKKMVSNANPNSAAERYRLAISDGRFWCVAMLATQLNEIVNTNQIHENTIFKLDEYLSNAVQGKKIIIILALSIIDVGTEGVPNIGHPVQQYPIDGSALPMQQPVKQEAQQPAPGIYQNGSRPTGYANASPGPQTSATGNQNQAPTYGAYSGYGAPGANPPQQPPSTNTYGQQQAGGGAYGQQQQGGNAYGAPQPGGAYGNRGGGAYGSSANQGPYGQPTPDYRAGGSAIARNEAPAKIVPISSLNAYQNKWTIKARVSVKGEMRRWSNARGEGKVFSFDLIDAAGGEIKATAFNDAVDKFHDLIQQGQVYTISKASLKPKRAAFNNTHHEYEIQLENGSVIKQCDDEPEDNIPKALYHFKKIEVIESMPAGQMLDVVGIVESAGEHQTITLKNGRDAEKRSVVLRDHSNRSIEITLWGNYANDPGQEIQQMVEQGSHPVLAVKTARVGDFNGKTLSTLNTSMLNLDPDIPEAGMLRNWYDHDGGAQQPAQSLSDQRSSGGGRVERRCTLGQIADEGMGSNGQPAFIQVAAWVNFIRGENLFYPACTGTYNGKQCNKKLTDQGNGWWCERCQAQGVPEWRYMLSLQVSDHSGQEWLTAFQEAGQEIMGMPASELKAIEDTPNSFDAALSAANFRPLIFNLRVAEDTYNDETRIKKSVNRVSEVDFVKESKVLLDFIEKMKRGEEIMQAAPAGQQPAFGAPPAAPRAGTSYGQGGGGYTNTPTRGGYAGPANTYSAGGGGYTGGGGGNAAGGYAPSNQNTGYGGQSQNNGHGAAPANSGYGGQSYGVTLGPSGGGFGQNGQTGYGGAPGGYNNYQRQSAQGPAGF